MTRISADPSPMKKMCTEPALENEAIRAALNRKR